jgi:hypothetical protein
MKPYEVVVVYSHVFLTSDVTGGEWPDSRGLDDIEKWKFLTLQGLELRPLGRPARSQSMGTVHCSITHVPKPAILISGNLDDLQS